MPNPKRLTFLLLTLSTVAWNSPVLALKSDKEQPIEITADRAERDEKLGITIYHGHVEIHQGSLAIEADHVVIKTPVTKDTTTEEIEEITTNGKPSHFQQQVNEGGDVVEATASTIHYRVNDKKVDLVNNAVLKQEGRVLTGENISYDIGSQRVSASSDTAVNVDGKPVNRVTVIIPAAKPHNNDGSGGDAAAVPAPTSTPSP